MNVSHGDSVIDSSTGHTKLDLVRYDESVAKAMLPHLTGSPCSLVRGPTGVEGPLSRFVAKSGPLNRVGKVFVDYLRNGHGATTVAAFSARARPGLGVSMPVAWDDLPTLKSGSHWTIATAREHVSFQRVDPWEGYWTHRQTLTSAMKALGFKVPRRTKV